MAAKPPGQPSKELPRKCAVLEENDVKHTEDVSTPNTNVTDVTLPSSPSIPLPPSCDSAQTCKQEAVLEKLSEKATAEEGKEEKKVDWKERKPQKKPFWVEDDELPPMM